MHPIDIAYPISPYCQHIVDEIFNHEINVSPQNDLRPIYDNYRELVDDEPSVVVNIIVYNKFVKALIMLNLRTTPIALLLIHLMSSKVMVKKSIRL